MSGKLCPKIILEGARLTFKTEIAFELNEHPRVVGPRKYRYHSPIISAEWCAFSNFPWGRGLINFNPDEEKLAMESYDAWLRVLELQKYYSWIIDRFHISTRMFQLKNNNREYEFRWIEERLLKIGFCLIFLYRDEDSFESALSERLKVSGNPSQYSNLGAFIDDQIILKRLVEESILPKCEINISDNNIKRAVEEIADFLSDNNLLYANY
ncbi:MAG TPA: hypothetical protein PK559_13150 [Ignavibacteriaceae bacterium]|nr:hypothetical protein [Ignavibacteriaceae bacterium]